MTSKAIRPFGDDWLAVLTRVADKQRAIEDDGGILWFRGALVHGSWALGRVTLDPLVIARAEGA